MRPEEIEALLQDAQHSPIDANSAHGSTHIPNINMVWPVFSYSLIFVYILLIVN